MRTFQEGKKRENKSQSKQFRIELKGPVHTQHDAHSGVY